VWRWHVQQYDWSIVRRCLPGMRRRYVQQSDGAIIRCGVYGMRTRHVQQPDGPIVFLGLLGMWSRLVQQLDQSVRVFRLSVGIFFCITQEHELFIVFLWLVL